MDNILKEVFCLLRNIQTDLHPTQHRSQWLPGLFAKAKVAGAYYSPRTTG